MSLKVASSLESSGRSQHALLDQIFPDLADLDVLLGDRLFLLLDPRRVLLRCDDLDGRNHEGVLTAAQLRALAVIKLVGVQSLEPRVGGETGYGIDLATERRYPPGVDHVACLDHQVDGLARGNDHLGVRVRELVRDERSEALGGTAGVADAVRVAPDELPARHADRQLVTVWRVRRGQRRGK